MKDDEGALEIRLENEEVSEAMREQWQLQRAAKRKQKMDLQNRVRLFDELSEGSKLETMSEWCWSNYRDPVDECPYHDGEYIYIYGGPYDIQEELIDCFGDEEEVLALIEEILPNFEPGHYYTGVPENDWFEQGEIHQIFRENIEVIRDLMGTGSTHTKELRDSLSKMLFSHTITLLETYLQDTMLEITARSPSAYKKFVEGYTPFSKENVTVRSVLLGSRNQFDNKVKDTLNGLMWHNLVKVKPLFQLVGVPSLEIGQMIKFISVRHDLVHRNGRNKKGDDVQVNDRLLYNCIDEAVKVVDSIESQIKKTCSPKINCTNCFAHLW